MNHIKIYSFLILCFAIVGISRAQNVGVGTTTPQNKLHVKGQMRVDTLTSGSLTVDSIVLVGTNGLFKKAQFNIATNEPWYNVATGTQATANTQDIYQMGKVGIGIATPATDAVLELSSANKSLLLTRVATTGAIANPENGMIVYDIASNCVKAYENGAWSTCLSSGSTANSTTVTIDCSNSSFSCGPKYVGTTGISVVFKVINNSFSNVTAVDFSNAVTLSGAGAAGLTVTAGQNSSVSINSGATATLTYNLTGAPTTAGTLTALFSRLGLSCTVNSVVYGASGGNGMDGTIAAKANLSCKSIKEAFPASADGVYWIDPDLNCTTLSAMQVQCDMTTAGGGWTKIAAGGDASTGTFSQTTSISNLTAGGYWPDNIAFKFGEMSISAIRITQASTFANANLRNWDLGDAIFTGTNVANWLKSTGTVPVTNLAVGWTGRFWNTYLFDGNPNLYNFRYPSLFASYSNSTGVSLCGNVWRVDLFNPSVNACAIVNSNSIWSTNLAGASYTCSTPVIRGVRVYWVR